ncbi:MAG: SusC/RagA family TonB-linked outer membrane protein, partial [Tannerella sp.]|nr:SusC/RagA family TonB-linked outer membrane protein [Tannerella sp.]
MKNICKFFMFLLFSVLSFVQLYGQTDNARKTVKGIVIDNSTGSPLIGVMVVAEKNRTIGTITDNDGRFELSLPEGINSLQFTYLGYLTRTIEIKGKSQLQVIMDEDIQQLSEVVVVGYGSQKKETLTGSIAVIDSKKLVETPTANISNMLVGRAPGILSNQASGEAGNDNTTIRIRGVATLNSSGYEPLIVIDGIQSSMSAMNALDANEIEKVSILKDASSTAVYGVKGANGVIIITTKRGNVSAPRINLSYRYGTTELVSKLKLLGSYEYALYRNEAITNDMEPGNYQHLFSEDELWKFRNNRDYTPLEIEAMNLTDEQKTALANSPAMYYGSHDFMEEQFGNLSPQQQYNINVSGGSESMKYFLSVGNYSQKGVFNNADYGGANINSTYDRFNFRSNIDINIFKNLMLSVDFGGQVGTKQGILGSSQDG